MTAKNINTSRVCPLTLKEWLILIGRSALYGAIAGIVLGLYIVARRRGWM